MFKKKKKKGFTLVELLAVIVILAVVILIAVTAVIPTMNKAKKNAFIDEALIYLKAAEEAYAFDDENIGSSCINITDLNDNYVKKSSDNYIGTITTELTNGDYVQTISLTNGKYYLVSSSTNMSADDVKSSMPQGFKSSCGNNNSMVAQCLNDDSSCLLPASLDGYSSVEVTRTGKNLYQFPYVLTLNLSGSGQNRTVTDSAITRSSIIPLKPGTTYTLSGNRTGASDNFGRLATFSRSPEVNDVSIRFLSYSNNNSVTFTAAADELFALVLVSNSPTEDCHMQLEVGSTPTTYEPYTSTTEIIPLGQTVYGGSIDLTTGVLTMTHGIVKIEDLTWYRTTNYSHPVWYAQIPDRLFSSTSNVSAEAFRSIGIIGNASQFANASVDFDISCSSSNRQVFVRHDSAETSADFIASVGNTYILYKLATPQTYQLTNISTSN